MVPAILDDAQMLKHAIEVIERAEKQGLYIRLLGAMAVRMHIQDTEFMKHHDKISRLGANENRKYTDIDVVAYSKQTKEIRNLFEKELGYKVDRMMLQYLRDRGRLVYYEPKGTYQVDVFFDKLEFSHDVDFGKGKDPKAGRLNLDYPTVPLADLFLTKLQIHQITEKDIKDLIVLFRSHDFSKVDEKDKINSKYIAEVLADDWEFWKEATENLKKVKNYTERYWREQNLIDREDALDVLSKVNDLLQTIDVEPKTKDWENRARKGESKQWWKDVEDINR